MLNTEKYKKELQENIKGNDYCFHVDKHTHEIKTCNFSDCLDCSINKARDGRSCFVGAVAWLLSEYREPIKLSRLEYEILKYILNHTEYKYIARDRLGEIFIYENKPEKHVDTWRVLVNGGRYTNLTILDELFKFIKWLDSEPTLIKDVLENCEVVEDAEEQKRKRGFHQR